jgi:hypothetical protein
MGLVHCHKRRGAFLALAALALQIVLSFGHVHLDGVVRSSSASGTTSQSVLPASRQTPAQNPTDDADGYCAICASIFLASTAFIPPVPQLPPPVGFERITLSFSIAFGSVVPRRVAFQSRAPPAV